VRVEGVRLANAQDYVESHADVRGSCGPAAAQLVDDPPDALVARPRHSEPVSFRAYSARRRRDRLTRIVGAHQGTQQATIDLGCRDGHGASVVFTLAGSVTGRSQNSAGM
jgi:hypothetical protein